MKVACFSVAAMDYFPQQGRYFAGGNSLNQAIRFRQLGHDSCFLGALGTDPAGDQIEKLLRQNLVDVSRLRRLSGTTASNQLLNDEKGERIGVEGAWSSGVYQTFVLEQSDWEYLEAFDIWTTHANGPDYEQALRHKTHALLAVDFLHFDTYELLEKGLDQIDIAYFGGVREQLADLVEFSRKSRGVIVLTLGAEGSIAIQKGITHEQVALPIDRVVDTTGCGDAFQAGFTAEYYRSRDIGKALLAGASLGRTAASTYGGVPWE